MPSPSAAARLHVENHGDHAVVRIATTQFGAADGVSADEQLLALIREIEQPLLALDFGNVSFLSSLGLALLLALHKQLAESGRRLTILNLQPHVEEIFRATRLDTVLTVQGQGAA